MARTAIWCTNSCRPLANRRGDVYGGSEANRMRFALEVAECVRAAWPSDKPLFMRLSCEDDAGWGPNESVRLARLLKRAGVDVIDCSSGGTLGHSPMDGARASRYGYQVPYAEKIRREADIMTMAVGHIVHADQAEAILQAGSRRPHRAGARDHVQPELADGRSAETWRRSPVQIGAAGLRLLAGKTGQLGLRRHALDLEQGPGRRCVGKASRQRLARRRRRGGLQATYRAPAPPTDALASPSKVRAPSARQPPRHLSTGRPKWYR